MTKGDGWKASLLTGGNLKELPYLDSHSLHCIGEYLYIFGGFESSPNYAHSNNIYRIDIDKQIYDKLQIEGHQPEPRMNFGSCLDPSSRLIILGGSGKNEKFSDLFRFDFVAKRWNKLSNQIIHKGIEGHQIVYNRFLESFMVYGGIHEASDENRHLIGVDNYGNVTLIAENQEIPGSPLLKDRYRNSKNITRSFSRVSDLAKSKFRDGKANSNKRYFLESDIERKFYNDEFVLDNERDRSEYRQTDSLMEEMKKSLFLFGTFKSQNHMHKLLAEEKFKDISEKKQNCEESELELLKQAFLKESGRPIPREGHIMFVLRDKLIIVGGMRHTLAFNDISYIACSSLQVSSQRSINNLNNQDIILDQK